MSKFLKVTCEKPFFSLVYQSILIRDLLQSHNNVIFRILTISCPLSFICIFDSFASDMYFLVQ